MNYTLNQLRIFLKLVETESVTRAAEELHLTQPAVSMQLKNFQAQFEIPLTELLGRRIHITDFGREIARSAEAIMEQVHSINYKTMAHRGQLIGKLKIAVVSTGKYVMPYFLTDFIKEHPGIELTMDVTNKSEVLRSLQSNETGLALVSILPTDMAVERLDLLKNKLYLVGKVQDPPKKAADPRKLFHDLPLIYREKGSGTRQTMERFIESKDLSVLRKMELTSNEAVKQSLLAGLGYSIMPLIGIRNELLKNELSIIPVKGLPITTTWSLIWMKGKKHAPAPSAFLDYLRESKARIIKDHFSWHEGY